jgi:hypothetical protein
MSAFLLFGGAFGVPLSFGLDKLPQAWFGAFSQPLTPPERIGPSGILVAC